jgi:hypothetical protein
MKIPLGRRMVIAFNNSYHQGAQCITPEQLHGAGFKMKVQMFSIYLRTALAQLRLLFPLHCT